MKALCSQIFRPLPSQIARSGRSLSVASKWQDTTLTPTQKAYLERKVGRPLEVFETKFCVRPSGMSHLEIDEITRNQAKEPQTKRTLSGNSSPEIRITGSSVFSQDSMDIARHKIFNDERLSSFSSFFELDLTRPDKFPVFLSYPAMAGHVSWHNDSLQNGEAEKYVKDVEARIPGFNGFKDLGPPGTLEYTKNFVRALQTMSETNRALIFNEEKKAVLSDSETRLHAINPGPITGLINMNTAEDKQFKLDLGGKSTAIIIPPLGLLLFPGCMRHMVEVGPCERKTAMLRFNSPKIVVNPLLIIDQKSFEKHDPTPRP
jgi:hypothetical protein